jgi:uncharacterized membrane protein YozB (DUF420 family)
VSWNHVVDLYGESILDFLPMFPVGKDALVRKQKTHVFALGMLTVVLSVISIIMLLYGMWLIRPKSGVKSVVSMKNPHQTT